MTTTLAESGLSTGTKIKRLKLLLYGPFGTWKTPNAHKLPRTRTLDFDDGMQSVEWAILAGKLDKKLSDIVYETIVPPASMKEDDNDVYDRAVDQVYEWLEEEEIPPEDWDRSYPQFWDTLIIDSGSALLYSTIIKGLKEMHRLKLSESWGKRREKGMTPRMIQDYGASGILFEKFMRLCYGTGKNIVLICHEYKNTDKKGNLLAIQPLLPGQLRESLPKDFDEVWYARVKGDKKNSKGFFQTQRDSMRGCRTRLGCLDADEPADFDAIRAKVAKFYGVPIERLWTAEHGTAALDAHMKKEGEKGD